MEKEEYYLDEREYNELFDKIRKMTDSEFDEYLNKLNNEKEESDNQFAFL